MRLRLRGGEKRRKGMEERVEEFVIYGWVNRGRRGAYKVEYLVNGRSCAYLLAVPYPERRQFYLTVDSIRPYGEAPRVRWLDERLLKKSR